MKKTALLLLAFGCFVTAHAQTDSSTTPLSITGSVDVYYKYDFSESKYNNKTSFTNSHNSFELGMATVKLEHKTSKFDVVADLGFGKRATEFAYNDNGILAAVKQLYISYSPADWIKFTAGSWATHVGYELVDAYANRNYSMSYMFTNGPFFHTGFKAEATKGKSGFMLGIANPTDFKYVPDGRMNKKFLLAQYSFAPSDQFKLYLNYVGGQGVDTSKTHQFDVVITSKISSKFSLGYNGTLNNTQTSIGQGKLADGKSWWGSALYLNLDASDHFGLTLREEYFSDKNSLKVYSGYLGGGSVFASTLSANVKIKSLILIPELRIDQADKNLFTNKNGRGAKTDANLLLAAVYVF
ncbi:MAG: porin [Williamsia sp.]|nr:porin [Williamsia sp.]